MFAVTLQADGLFFVRHKLSGHAIITSADRIEGAKETLEWNWQLHLAHNPPAVDTWQAGVYDPAQPQLPLPQLRAW